MASGGVLPTHQRYLNGVPISQGRRSAFRLREKYVVLLVFATFSTVCFGAFFFLPDLRDRVSVDEIKRQLGPDIFIPQQIDPDNQFRHNPEENEDVHKKDDMQRIKEKAGVDWEDKHKEIIENVRKQLNISKQEHENIRNQVQGDKNLVVQMEQDKIEADKNKIADEMLKEQKDHEEVEGTVRDFKKP